MRHTLLLLPLIVLLSGCLEREERVTVAADGGVTVEHRFQGDAAEFGPIGDALPEAGGPWTVTDEEVARPDGKGSDHVRRASARFSDAAALPEGFGRPGDAAALRFTTQVTRERLPDGSVRTTFERRYLPRGWAWRERLRERHLPQALLDRLGKEEDAAKREAAKREALAGLLAFERAKGQALVERALQAVAVAGEPGGVTARRALDARARFAAAFDAAWKTDDVLKLVSAPRAEQAALEARYRSQTLDAAVAAGVDAALAPGSNPAMAGGKATLEATLRAALEGERRMLEATEDLQDETFCVRVTLPGQVVLTDGEALEDGGRTAVFRFGGKELAESPPVLRAVSIAKP